MGAKKAIFGYLTEYVLIDQNSETHRYCSYILANTIKQCNELIIKRNLNETVDCRRINFLKINQHCLIKKLSLESDRYFLSTKNKTAIIHYVCFLSFLAYQCGSLTAYDILSDVAVLHEAIHFVDFQYKMDNKKYYLENLRKLLENLESKVIGVFPK